MKITSLLLIVSIALVSNISNAQNGCQKDDLGRIFCAPPGGTAVNSMTGIACAPGRCIIDDLGYLKCSNQTNGGVIKDDLGRVVCVGACVSPTKEYCQSMKGNN